MGHSLAVTPGAAGLTAEFSVRRPDFSLHVRLEVGAEILVLFGPSGSGKTTTLSAIAGLVTPERGRVLLDGQVLFERDGAGRAVNVPTRAWVRRRRTGSGIVTTSAASPLPWMTRWRSASR